MQVFPRGSLWTAAGVGKEEERGEAVGGMGGTSEEMKGLWRRRGRRGGMEALEEGKREKRP